jgi:hypothetical protein
MADEQAVLETVETPILTTEQTGDATPEQIAAFQAAAAAGVPADPALQEHPAYPMLDSLRAMLLCLPDEKQNEAMALVSKIKQSL